MRTKLQRDEKLLMVVHQHWLVLGGSALLAVAGLATAIIWFHTLSWWGLGVAALLVAHFIWRILVRKYNLWVITDQRIIDEFGVLSCSSKESPLDKINNVGYHQSLLGRILGYGDVEIQTASEMGATIYDHLAHPGKVKDCITEARGQANRHGYQQEGAAIGAAVHINEAPKGGFDFAQEMEGLVKLKAQGIITEKEYDDQKAKLLNR